MPKSHAGRLTFALIVFMLVGIITRNAYHHVQITIRGTNASSQHLPDLRLYHAAFKGDLNEVNALLARGADVNAKTRYGIPLQAALQGQFASPHDQHVEVVRTLLAHHANPNPPQDDWHHFLGNLPLAPGESPLVLAIARQPIVVPELLQRGADVNVGYGEPLRQAIRSRHLDMVRELLRRGANVNPLRPPTTDYASASRPQTPFSPLLVAAFAGSEYEAALRQAGARVDAVDKQTILLQIIRWGVEDADRQNVQSPSGQLDQEKIIPKLLALGAEINGMDSLGRTPLTEAVVYAPSLVKMLVEHGADPNSAAHRQDSPLYLAIRANRADIARLLLAHGANVNARPLHGNTALDYARAHHQADILALLQKAGAKDE